MLIFRAWATCGKIGLPFQMFQIIRRLNVNGKQPLSPRCSSQPTSLKCTDREGLVRPRLTGEQARENESSQ